VVLPTNTPLLLDKVELIMYLEITQHQGKTLPYLAISIVSGIIAFICFFFIAWIAIPFIALVILLSFIETGISFDLQTNSFRYYKQFGKYAWGNWKQLDTIAALELEMDVLRPSRYRRSNGQLSLASTQPTYISYDMYAHNSSNVKQLIYEFDNYKSAKLFSNQLASTLNCPLKNEIEEQLIENKQKRFTRLGRRR
jgi:hypothetical protein